MPQSLKNEKIFVFAYQNFRQAILDEICLMIKDRQAAEDIVHDVFLKLWAKKNIIEDIKDMKAFLWVSARNHCINEMKRKKRITLSEGKVAGNKMNLECPAGYILQRETEKTFQLAVESLSPQRKKIFNLSWVGGYNQKQIADHLNISTYTVKASLQNARRDIRLFMKKNLVFENKKSLNKIKRIWDKASLKQVA